MAELPQEFIERMAAMKGFDIKPFLASYSQPPTKGLTVNTLKSNIDEIAPLCPCGLESVGITKTGFRLVGEWQGVGNSPAHIAGLFYMQEPSAMLPVSLADIRPGQKVLDMCAAPGGKSFAAAAALMGEGLLVSNEIVFSRAKILASTIERMGAINCVVTSNHPDNIARALPLYFDRVIVDAPCSGEGMFRKDMRAREEWSEEHVHACAARQRLILASAAKCVARGGKLIYSTCTFSYEENEKTVEAFLAEHGDFALIERKRLYPHLFMGEGHFAAVLERAAGESEPLPTQKLVAVKDKAYDDFVKDTFVVPPKGIFDGKNILQSPLPKGLAGLKCLSSGVYAGESQKGRFIPSHTLAVAQTGAIFKRSLELNENDPRLWAYLKGSEVDCPENWKGWCAVSYRGHRIGLGKAVEGRLKNHFPKGLRLM